MSPVKSVRRAVARLRLDDEAVAMPRIGHRDLHDFWPLLAESFRPVLLAPHQRADEDALTWTWREPEEGAAPSAADLAVLRQQLGQALAHFSSAVAAGRARRGSHAPWLAASAEQVEAVMGEVVRGLVARGDGALAGYVCRTEQGWRLHSWGARTPARPTHPDTQGLEISGRVLVAGAPARHDVVLESSDGETLAEVPSDEGGEFTFGRLSPGEYRLRARSVRGTFPPQGIVVDLQRRSVKGVVLADARADTTSPLVSARRARAPRSRLGLGLGAAGLLLAGGTWYFLTPRPPAPAPVSPAAIPATAAGQSRGVVVPVSASAAVSPTAASGPAGTASVSLSSSGPAQPLAPEPRPPVAAALEPPPLVRLPDAAPAVGQAAGAPPPVAPTDLGASAGQAGNVTATASSSAPGQPAGTSDVAGESLPSGAAASSSAKAATSAAGATAASTAGAPSAPPPPPDDRQDAATVKVASATSGSDAPPAPSLASAASASVHAAAATAVAQAATVQAEEAAPPAAAAGTASPEPVALAPSPPPPPVSTAPRPIPPVPSSFRSEPPLRRIVAALPEAAPLSRTVRVRVSSWRPRLLVDTILPTAPLRQGEPESIEQLRARLLAEQEARLPGLLRSPAARWGVALDFGATGAGEQLRWRDHTGAVVAGSTVSGGRAEVLWSGDEAEPERVYHVVRRDGAMLAEVRVDATGREFTLRTPEDTATWLRLAVDRGTSDGPAAASGRALSFQWRSLGSEALPSGWHEPGAASTGAAWIVDAPLGAQRGAAALQACALFDADTGWSIVADVRQAADRPLGQ